MLRSSLALCGVRVMCVFVLAAVAGCNRSPYEMAQVHGVVTVDGKPLPACQVMFAPRAKDGAIESGKPAIGWLDEQGRFKLSTYSDGDGAVVGEHMVTLYGPANIADLPAGIPKFKRVAIQGKAIQVEAGKDNEVKIDLALKDLQPRTFQGRKLKQ